MRESSSSGEGLLSDSESSRRLDVVPVLLSEGVRLLLKALLALGKTLVLADSHDCDSGCWTSRRVVLSCRCSKKIRSESTWVRLTDTLAPRTLGFLRTAIT